MTIKKVTRNILLVEDDRWRKKGGPMKTGKEDLPNVCPNCNGFGYILNGNTKYICSVCQGLGESYD